MVVQQTVHVLPHLVVFYCINCSNQGSHSLQGKKSRTFQGLFQTILSFFKDHVIVIFYKRLFKHHALISQNSQTFPKLEKLKINSRTFPDFKDPWEPCFRYSGRNWKKLGFFQFLPDLTGRNWTKLEETWLISYDKSLTIF